MEQPVAQEPDNLVLQMLREIRTTLAEHSGRFDEIDARLAQHSQAFAEIREELRQVNHNCVYALGFSTLNQRDSEATKQRVTALETRVRRLEEQTEPT